MATYRQQFEEEMRAKLVQKANAHNSEETVLIKAFKYFDLDNSGTVSKNEWKKAIERIGVSSVDEQVIQTLFTAYDTDKNGSLDYKEFSAALFGGASPAGRAQSSAGPRTVDYQAADAAIENLRKKLAARGARGIIGLGKQFRIMDDDNSRSVDLYEFTKAIKDYRVNVDESDIEIVFAAIDRDRSGYVDYEEFLRAIRGPMNQYRTGLVEQAFNKLDADGSGVIDISDVKRFYNAANHPDVLAGKKTEDDILEEFLETFETHHSINGEMDHHVTQDEFHEYYTNISASIDNDQYFELMMNNAWKLKEAPAYTNQKGWSNTSEETKTPSGGIRRQGGKRQAVSSGAPPRRSAPADPNDAVEKVRRKLAARGTRGILGLSRLFKIMDDNNSKTIDFSEWTKACHDFRLELTEQEAQTVFASIDRDHSGEIDYDELLRVVRGPMNAFRKGLVRKVYAKLDRDNSGVVDIADLRGVYTAKNHPDVKSGKKTEEDVLCDFLETFELHHNISDKSRMDHVITYEEFEEYYTNVSSSIDDDSYFELIISNAWKLYGEPVNREAWAGQWSGQNFKESSPGKWTATKTAARGTVSRNAPFDTNDEPTIYETNLRPVSRPQSSASSMPFAGQATQPGSHQTSSPSPAKSDLQLAVQNFRQKLASRGARGIIGLARQFRIMDDSGDRRIQLPEFIKAIKDYRIDVPDEHLEGLFHAFDNDGSGDIDYDEFLYSLRGEMSQARVQLVEAAFNKMDKSGDGILSIEDIKGVYNARNHPDVRNGKKTEDEVLGEFLSTFETHHSITHGGAGLDQRVDKEEFLEYYACVSSSIDDDRYFELMMNNAWNFEGKTYEKAWANDVTEPPQRRRYF